MSKRDRELIAVCEQFRTELRGCPKVQCDEKTGRSYMEVVFKEGTTPDLTKLPAKIGGFPVRHDFRKPFLSFGVLQDMFNKHAAEIETVQSAFGDDLVGLRMHCDNKTSDPTLVFDFKLSSTPDLQKLPVKIGPFNVKHEFHSPELF